ncbi:MAG TPA: hypothetical protein VFK80_00215 [Limnochordia bacterium]|nr:hypothetical protein [Limnochordia bacterium]
MRVEPLDFSISAQRGMVEAVERGLIRDAAWRQIVPVWEHLLAASGDLDAWQESGRSGKGGRSRGG